MQTIDEKECEISSKRDISLYTPDVAPTNIARRVFVLGMSATTCEAVFPGPAVIRAATTCSTIADTATVLCYRWLAISAEIERLQSAWGKTEEWLAKQHRWLQLTPAERDISPWANKLREIEMRLNILYAARDGLLETLPSSNAPSIRAITARLTVALKLLAPYDDPAAYRLILEARRELVMIGGEL